MGAEYTILELSINNAFITCFSPNIVFALNDSICSVFMKPCIIQFRRSVTISIFDERKIKIIKSKLKRR